MEDKNKVTIGIETRGFEEAAEDIELMADAIAELPAVVNIKAKDCKIRIKTTNIIAPKDDGVSGYAPGGVIPKPEGNGEEGEIVWPKNKLKEELTKEMIEICTLRSTCRGCFLQNKEGSCFLKDILYPSEDRNI